MLKPRVLTAAAVLLAASLWCGDAAQASTSSPSDKQVAGEVVVAGGQYNDYILPNVDVFDGPFIPSLPEGVYGNTLNVVGSVLYSCGGIKENSEKTADCYILDTSQGNLKWTLGFTLPRAMAFHTAVTVGNDIWFTYENYAYVYDVLFMSFVEYQTPFSAVEHCAVSNASHSFVIGAGKDRKEIWMNSVDLSPETWEKVYDMPTECFDCGCLWSGNEIFITGGLEAQSITQIFDVSSSTMESGGNLVQPRDRHGMCHFDGKPAVVGGISNHFLDSVETYDSDTQKWSLDDRTLGQARDNFGLAQF